MPKDIYTDVELWKAARDYAAEHGNTLSDGADWRRWVSQDQNRPPEAVMIKRLGSFESIAHGIRAKYVESAPEVAQPKVGTPAAKPATNGHSAHAVAEPAMLPALIVIFVHPDTLKPSPHNPPSRTDERALRDLVESIRQYGIRKPIQTTHDWIVIDGNRRLAAAKILGLQQVPVLPEPPGADALALYETLNTTARKLTASEELVVHLHGGKVSKSALKAIRYIAEACGEEILHELARRFLSPISVRTRAVHLCHYCGRADDLAFRDQAIRWIVKHGQVAIRRAIADLVEVRVILEAVEGDRALELERKYGIRREDGVNQ